MTRPLIELEQRTVQVEAVRRDGVKVVQVTTRGAPGPAGPAGVGSLWRQGAGAPAAELGGLGDFYLRTSNGDIYGPKTSGGWGSVIFNIAQGQQGPAGATGAQGPAGAAGTDGKTLRSGAGAPGAGVGVDGDFYIDTVATVIYGPKAAGAWPAGVSLIGPTGPAGATGPAGPTGGAGPTGATGPTGVVTATAPATYDAGTQAVGVTLGTTAATAAAGNDARFHNAVTLAASVADVLNLSGQELQADDPGGDRMLFWDDSEGKLTHAAVGPGLQFDGTTLRVEEWLWVACSDEDTALTTGTAKITFRMPFAATLLSVRANVKTAPAGVNPLVVDINESGTSVLSTKLSIDTTEKTSTTAATAAVISDSSLADDAEITIDIDQVGSSTAGTGLKVGLYVRRI